MDYSSLDYDWIYNIRSIPAVVLPAVVFMVVVLCRKRKTMNTAAIPMERPQAIIEPGTEIEG